MRAHPEQQRLERLAGAVDADVRDRRRGQDAAHRVARLGLDRLLVDEVGVARVLRVAVARPLHHRRQQIAVRVEQRVHLADVARAEPRLAQLGVAVVAVATAEARVVRDVARRLLEVGHEPAPLEHLREQVRRLLAREVHATELGDGVVAVFEEHAVVELLRPPQPTLASTVRSPLRSRSATNSSRNRRRRLLSERE